MGGQARADGLRAKLYVQAVMQIYDKCSYVNAT